MDQAAIFKPVLALVALTFCVALRILFMRLRSIGRQHIRFADFAHGESPRVPPEVALANRNYMNLLELPMLFYALALTLFVTKQVDGIELTLAWVYVALRIAHSAVHNTYNHVVHRLAAFVLSNFVLSAMWAIFAARLLT